MSFSFRGGFLGGSVLRVGYIIFFCLFCLPVLNDLVTSKHFTWRWKLLRDAWARFVHIIIGQNLNTTTFKKLLCFVLKLV